jgi:hypothetical protein
MLRSSAETTLQVEPPLMPGFSEEERNRQMYEVYTSMGVEFAKEHNYFEEPVVPNDLGYFKGRYMIGRNTRINGGVWIDGLSEALVVDESKSPETIAAYQALMERVSVGDSVDRGRVLDAVYDVTNQYLPYRLKEMEDIARPYYDCHKINLGVFIEERAGACRHQALLVGYLLEKLKDDGRIRGQVSVRRNIVKGRGGHAWAEYTNSGGDSYVIDPAQEFLGTKQEAAERARFRVFQEGCWRY